MADEHDTEERTARSDLRLSFRRIFRKSTLSRRAKMGILNEEGIPGRSSAIR